MRADEGMLSQVMIGAWGVKERLTTRTSLITMSACYFFYLRSLAPPSDLSTTSTRTLCGQAEAVCVCVDDDGNDKVGLRRCAPVIEPPLEQSMARTTPTRETITTAAPTCPSPFYVRILSQPFLSPRHARPPTSK